MIPFRKSSYLIGLCFLILQRDFPNDEDMNEFWMIKSEGLLKSQMEIVDDHLNQAVSANYNDFLTGIKLIQEIDLDLSRSDIFVQNTRRMLEASRKQVTIISFTQFSFSIFILKCNDAIYIFLTTPWSVHCASASS